FPAESFANCICCRTSQDRHCQKTRSNQTQSHQDRRRIASQRTKCFSCLRSGINVGIACLVQGSRVRKDYEIHDEIGEQHAEKHIPGGVFQFSVRRLAASPQSLLTTRDSLFHFLTGLPEEEVRRDRRPENCHKYLQELRIQSHCRQKGSPEY